MKSGLEGRNNDSAVSPTSSISRLNEVRPRRPEQLEPCTGQEYALAYRLNEVRPRRPEQSVEQRLGVLRCHLVSMKSGLEGRNNLMLIVFEGPDKAGSQ